MTLKPIKFENMKLRYLENSGADKKKYALITAAYNDRTETGLRLIETDPDQITAQDPFAGLTALHVAIVRQNRELVKAIATHPKCDPLTKDNFGRRAIDMLDYTTDQEIFRIVMDAADPEGAQELEEISREDATPADVVQFKPKSPAP